MIILDSKKSIRLVRITTVPISLEKLIAGQMRHFSEKNYEVFMISSDFNRKFELERRENSRFIPVNMSRDISIWNDLKALVKLILVLKRIKPHIVHTHTPKAGLLGMVAAKIANVPVRLHTVAGLPLMEYSGIKRMVLNLMERITYWSANSVYPNSKSLKQFIVSEKLCKPSKLKVFGEGSSNGIDIEYFRSSEQIVEEAAGLRMNFNLQPTDFVFVFVGRIVKDKGINELIEAFVKLSNTFKNAKLLLVGNFEENLNPISRQTMRLMKHEGVIFAGYQDDIRPYLALSNVLVLPSYREGFPNVPMQAGCFDLPCIVSDINGCNEIIVNEQNGLLIKPKSVSDLFSAMERMLLDKSLYILLKKNARKMVVSRYDQKEVWQHIALEYQRHLGKIGL